jgi:hypothetical protein
MKQNNRTMKLNKNVLCLIEEKHNEQESKAIHLTQVRVAIVDTEDHGWLTKFKWHAHKRGRTWYARRAASKKTIFMHRAILEHHGYDLTSGEIDHINGDGLDNRKSNLQVISHAENIRKSRVQINNKSGFRGVSWHKGDRRWQVVIEVDNIKKYVGSFRNKIAAALAYDQAAKKCFGKFAKLNLPDIQNSQMQLNKFVAAATA